VPLNKLARSKRAPHLPWGTNRRRGHDSKLTPEIAMKIFECVREGNYIETAAAYVGVAPSTLRLWLQRGRRAGEMDPSVRNEEDEMYLRFTQGVENAQAQAEVDDIKFIRGSPEWTARAWRLERRFPEKYGRRERVDMNVQGRVDVGAAILDAYERAIGKQKK